MNARSLVLGTLEQLGLPYWVTGSDALALTGYARSTVDTDIVVDITPVDYDARLRPPLEASGLYVAELVRTGDRAMGQASGGPTWVDVILPAPGAWTSACRERRVRVHDPIIDRDIWVISPEDLVVAKLAWGAGASARQAEDATRILAASQLDLAYCRWAAVELGVARELESVLEAAHAG